MMPVLIGSRALQYWNPTLKLKDDADWDVISFKQHSGCEVHDPLFLNNMDMTDYALGHNIIILPDKTKALVMSPTGLAIIKRSHLHRDLNFDRHITMFHKFGLSEILKEKSHSSIANADLQERIRLTKEAFPQRNPNLMQSKEDFFDDFVTRKYDHDYLHELVAFYDKPLYVSLLRDEKLAWCEQEKWYNLSHKDKVKCVAEETFVIAIERFMVPNNWNYPSKLAYIKALRKVCTTLCSGLFRDFAIDLYPEVMAEYRNSVFVNVKSKLE